MRLISFLPFLHMAYFYSPVLCRRGAHGGDGDGDRGGSAGSGSSGDGVLPEQGLKPNFEPRCPFGSPYECPCLFTTQRLKLYGLPGLYYNGTLTVTHRISANSAYTVGNMIESNEYRLATNFTDNTQCAKDETEEKTYKYPGLFYVGPRGIDDDPNPLHWSLKGFELTDGPYLDILQRLVHIRSSDFNMERPEDRRFTYWEETNANDPDWSSKTVNGTAYWSTSLTEAKDGGSYSARSTYDHRVLESVTTSGPLSAKSQYITLTEMCRLGHVSVNERFERRPNPDTGEEEEDEDEDVVYETTMRPTVWLETGAEANIRGIGSDKLTFSLDTKWTEPTEAAIGFRRAGLCGEHQMDMMRGFQHFLYSTPVDGIMKVSPDGHKWDLVRPIPEWKWNLTLSANLEFEGSLVREDSTEIKGLLNGIMQFAKDYDWEEKEKELGYPGTRPEEDEGVGDSGPPTVEMNVLSPILAAILTSSIALHAL